MVVQRAYAQAQQPGGAEQQGRVVVRRPGAAGAGFRPRREMGDGGGPGPPAVGLTGQHGQQGAQLPRAGARRPSRTGGTRGEGFHAARLPRIGGSTHTGRGRAGPGPS
ncbi:hypothetical protein GCM10010302_29300 [Streptomyces polychromogenes]|uniref:Uncharacterized protein n=1 Tax=Streptomyces polychromogenes TaxID=67342 RepID=A0ABP3F0B0_9ACTN